MSRAKDLGPALSAEEVAIVQRWNQADKALKAAKETEANLRAQVQQICFRVDPGELCKGTKRRDCGNGISVKLVSKINYSFVDQDKVDEVLDRIEQTDSEGALLARRLVKVKYELSVSEYDKLPDRFRRIIDEIIVSKPATPSVEVEFPKA